MHELHASLVATGLPVLTAHVVVEETASPRATCPGCSTRCSGRPSRDFSLEHSTIQLEPVGHSGHEAAAHP